MRTLEKSASKEDSICSRIVDGNGEPEPLEFINLLSISGDAAISSGPDFFCKFSSCLWEIPSPCPNPWFANLTDCTTDVLKPVSGPSEPPFGSASGSTEVATGGA